MSVTVRREVLTAEHGGLRLDGFLAERLPRYSRGYLKDLIQRGFVKVGGKARGADYRLKEDEIVDVEFPAPRWEEGGAFEDWVLHEDSQLLVLDKPAGLLMHPLKPSWLAAPGAALTDPEPNLAGILQTRRPALLTAKVPRCGIVHRLDRQTSGVLLVAKTPKAYEALVSAFKERTVEKIYRAVVRGVPGGPMRIEAPVGRKPGHRQVIVTPFGKAAETGFKVLETAKTAALVEGKPLTGRTHQIRAHLAYLAHPVAGDPEFDREGAEPRAPRTMLHAYRIGFAHPKTGKKASFKAGMPEDFRAFWARCRAL